MRFLLTILLFLPVLRPLAAQTDFTGSWKGILTQNEGGYKSEYKFEIYLIQKGKKLVGRTYVSVDNIYAELEIEGLVVDGSTIQFKETRLMQFTELEHLSWCYKFGQLQVKKVGNALRLEGWWEGITDFGPCIPGKVFLTRQVPQA